MAGEGVQTQIQLRNVESAINGDVYKWIIKGRTKATDTVFDTVCENPTEPATAVIDTGQQRRSKGVGTVIDTA
jgi:hypothetical protein